jgi:hypothetical protein
MKLQLMLFCKTFLLVSISSFISAFTALPVSNRCPPAFNSCNVKCTALKSVKEDSDSAFSAFVESMDEGDIFSEDEEDEISKGAITWQESLEQLLDPTTAAGKRQILLSDLLNSNEKIRNDVQAALRDRKVKCLFSYPNGEYCLLLK